MTIAEVTGVPMRAFRRVRDFHRNEAGLEALQVVLIVGIAALILALLKYFWQDVKNWFAITAYNLLGFGED